MSFIRADSGWRFLAGPVCFLAFVAVEVAVDYVLEVEFRSPPRPEILVPYLALFFGSILLMSIPMFRIDLRRLLVTALTTLVLLGAMGFAMTRGVA